jgi:hypothetical protein
MIAFAKEKRKYVSLLHSAIPETYLEPQQEHIDGD